MLQELSGRDTFPNIFFNGKTLGGFDQLDELHATGQLDILFKDILIPK
jgi:glutaredoxin